MKEGPQKELLTALGDVKKKVSPLMIHSIQDHINNDNFNVKKDSLDFLDVKNGLVLSYLIDLSRLTQLQLRGKTKEDSQVEACLKRLNEMKALLEKTRPMEKKMRYQLDKLLSLSSTSSTFASAGAGGDDATLSVNNNNDPLSFRPNPEKMITKGEDDNESDDDDNDDSDTSITNNSDDDDDELKAAKAALSEGKKKNKKDVDNHSKVGIYKAPRLASVPFATEEKEEQKKERILKKQKERMRKSEFLQTIQSQFGEKPEEDDMGGGATIGKQREAARRLTERDAEKTRYEEESFVRLATSRKEKKARNRIMREEASNLNAISDIGNIANGFSMAFDNEDDDVVKNVGNERIDENERFSNGKRKKQNPNIEINDDIDNNSTRRKSAPRGGKNSFQRTLYGQSSGNKKKKTKK
eukprot:CAMPEP_0197829180 /NCGR_PEP_ID=MMETSP1437-20131217/5630_1 /TAXON_ID=49252 ORGANISM="Eucampia antarctica, Strain CCMP1452" /NCGR_SAMPLE_ID=MMETSP1437 /ASSEMBLY_ACC=CAM_ASM_001096 /LENGTH=411 /DNA_ID=CAMNT_0043430713 /DNA_START=177 /DNA_END=1412 /DNA_ORIENTATION=-